MFGAPSEAGQAQCKAIMRLFEMVYLTHADMDWSMRQMEQYRLSRGVGINDCLIASVSYRLQVPLYTHNLKDMHVLLGTAAVIQPYK